MKDSSKKALLKNSLMLYILTFSNYFFSFITVPYQTRVLGPDYFGRIGVATAFMMYFTLFLDFGFLLSATEDVAKNRTDKKKLSQIYSSVTLIKLFFCLISLLFFSILLILIPSIKDDLFFYMLFFIATLINTFLPDYLYRGLEKMDAITYRTVIVRVISTICVFIFVKEPKDYIIIPLLNIFSNTIAVLIANYHSNKVFGIKLIVPKKNEVKVAFNNSISFFASRIISTVYTSTSTLIVKMLDPTGVSVGYYTASDKLMGTGKSLLTPISDSVYPYMVKNKDFKLINKILKIFMPIIILGTVIIFIFAYEFCGLLLGDQFYNAGGILRALLPIAIITLPEYLYGFPTLGAMGLTKYANRSVYFGTSIFIILLGILYLTKLLNPINLALLTSITEFSILAFRGFVIFKNRHLIK